MSDIISSTSFRFGLLTISAERSTHLDDNNNSDVTCQFKAKAEISFQRISGDETRSSLEQVKDEGGIVTTRNNRNKSAKVPIIPEFDTSQQILDYLKVYDCTNINEVSVKSNEGTTESEINGLVDFLRVNYYFIHVERLSMRGCNIGTETFKKLGHLLKTVKSTICELDLSDNKNLKAAGLRSVVDVLITNADDCTTTVSSPSNLLMENFEIDQFERSSRYQLSRLDLSNTGLVGSPAGTMIASLLRNNSTICELILANNRLGHRGIKLLATAFRENKTLIKLDVSCNNICDRGLGALMEGFLLDKDDVTTRSSIVDLDLSGNTFTPTGASRMVDSLLERQLRNISILRLNSNSFGFDTVHNYAYLLQFSFTLMELTLSKNNLQDSVIEIVNALHKNREETALKKLDISWNNITDKACTHIAKMIMGNITLESLNVSNNNIAEHGVGELTKALFENTTLTDLNILGNQIQNLRTLCLSLATINSN
jgi:Ran GTPase-activating protein (RanGAP) involved in mRNA processing and transport